MHVSIPVCVQVHNYMGLISQTLLGAVLDSEGVEVSDTVPVLSGMSSGGRGRLAETTGSLAWLPADQAHSSEDRLKCGTCQESCFLGCKHLPHKFYS